jgi:hypothetical protein
MFRRNKTGSTGYLLPPTWVNFLGNPNHATSEIQEYSPSQETSVCACVCVCVCIHAPMPSPSTSTNLALQQKANNSPYTDRWERIKNKKAAITYNVQIVSWSHNCLLIVPGDDKEKKQIPTPEVTVPLWTKSILRSEELKCHWMTALPLFPTYVRDLPSFLPSFPNI